MAEKKRSSRKSKKERLEEARPISLEHWLEGIRTLDSAAEMAGAAAPRGACLIKDPHTGEPRCIRTTKDACAALKGAFIGGPCGG